ncbi:MULTISPECIES: methylmalonyl Co-A mutase-associated GTPase MeaB [Carboxydocella]|uniref:LAO/AO transport system kinase n=2 Tax=Carboxydocella TaxID=178898 RepID=A0A1T4LUP9_9FIRM|nr:MULTISPECIES: methylmalonyl Co-A mutase-associated GTPase MeaB [Carboxydocella]AVX20613.1 LAO/AO transport system kinase [Carboxydocella thermautotrophica]AVX31035.1 LAO/AO transport system kinase [Carboxydocella thermautotrophica]SJZ58184.1 LAO/AO transport system kinase [Carboxydocella sporoproducens DSM 16521]GAW27936.1 hypothetical protein ULO1_05060 [Carboxydocella sp. ULO1]GAW31541.1 hypothetical protein JDF658_13060 [Carboxydocella sp. JDF658]
MHSLVEGLLQGNKRSAAKLITIIENQEPQKEEMLAQIFPHTGNAFIIGITGSPGAGKSSLVDSLIRTIRSENKTVGIIAVDPSSPFTGGALLGDRIRMQEHALDPGVFIRSMGTRGSLGGLAHTTRDALRVLDAMGIDVILIETVGVGQSELDIMNVADTTVVVLTPGAGDHIQTIKAGIMEIADVFAVNKGDLPGADKVVTEVEAMLDLGCHTSWRPPVIKTSNLKQQGINELWEAINKHKQFLIANGLWEENRKKRFEQEVLEIVELELRKTIHKKVVDTPLMHEILQQVLERKLAPYNAAISIIRQGLNLKI